MILRGEVTAACITATVFPNLDIVVSDDPEGHLPNWLLNRIDRGFRLRFALQAAVVANAYDCVLIDTQGAIGLQTLPSWLPTSSSRRSRRRFCARVQGRHDGTARPAGAGQRPAPRSGR